MHEAARKTDRLTQNGSMKEQTANIHIHPVPKSRVDSVDLDEPGFGVTFSDHMLSMKYRDKAWQTPEIVPFDSFSVSPAMCSIHYGQAIFEGMKAFYNPDGSIRIFRPETHHERFNRSGERVCIPKTDYQTFIRTLEELIRMDSEWVPQKQGNALYIRPFIFATDNYLSVKVSETYQFFVITSPVGAYYKEGINPVSLITSENYVRAVRGGVGNIKTPGNYAASLLPAQKAKDLGYTQVLWLDAVERKYVEEVGTMNMFFKVDGTLITPPLEGSILGGVTRNSVLNLAKSWDIPIEERRISIDEIIQHNKNGKLEEAFGTGTAAVISPVGRIKHKDEVITINDFKMGPFARRLYDTITGIQYGTVEDPFGWMHPVTHA